MTRQRNFKLRLQIDEDSISDFLHKHSIFNDGFKTDLYILSDKHYLVTNNSVLLEKLQEQFPNKVQIIDNDFDLSTAENIYSN